jgi:hypothetical protein
MNQRSKPFEANKTLVRKLGKVHAAETEPAIERGMCDVSEGVENPHTPRLLALARQLADQLLTSGQRNPSPEIVEEITITRMAERNWKAGPKPGRV